MRFVLVALALAAVPAVAAARALAPAPPAASPAPSASPSAAPGPSDPCAALSSLVSRPTFGTSPCAVKPHDLLIESGYTNLTAVGIGAGRTVTVPQASLRVGSAPNLEFDLDPSSIVRLSGPPAVTATSATSLGVKYELGYTSRVLYGVNVLYTTGSGDPIVSGTGDGVLANVNAALTLSPALGLFATVGYNAQGGGTPEMPARYHGVDPSLGASLSLPASFSLALEGFGQSSTGPGLGGSYGVDAAAERDFGTRLQLDLNYYQYLGAPNGTHQHAIGFGAAYLIGS